MPSVPKREPGPGSPEPGAPWVVWAVAFYGLLAAVGIGWNTWAGTPWAFLSEAAAEAGVRWGRDSALGLVTAAAVIGLSHWVTTRTGWGETMARELGRVLGALSWRDALLLAAASGFAEEAFFRGALQPRLGWGLTSLVFGLAHVPPSRALLPWTGFAVLAGGLLGGLYVATGNLVAPVVAHAGINAINLRLLSVRYGGGPVGLPGDVDSTQRDGVDLDGGAEG